MLDVDQQAGIEIERDRHPVTGLRRLVAQGRVGLAPPPRRRHALGKGGLHVLARANECGRVVAVDDHRVGGFDTVDRPAHAADHGDVESARDDRDVGMRRPFLQ